MRRRTFIQLASAALTAPALFAQNARQKSQDTPLVDQVPQMLDHLLLGCPDLQSGIDFVEQHTGVRAAFGGIHPGRGTQNALLSLGPSTPTQIGHYLEIIAPDPRQQTENPLAKKLQALAEPRLVGWAAHLRNNIEAFAATLKQEGIAAEGPIAGSRKRPDGNTLQWKTLNLHDDSNGLLPFFIQWSPESTHPSADSPQGCQLLRFELDTPEPAPLAILTAKLRLDAIIIKDAKPQLRAAIKGPSNTLSLSS